MLDSIIRPYIAPSLDKIGEKVSSLGLHPSLVTSAALISGITGCLFLLIESYLFGLIFVLLSRVISGLYVPAARRSDYSEFGEALHTLSIAVFYAAFIFFFTVASPVLKLVGLFLLFSYFIYAGSQFMFESILDKRNEEYEPGKRFHVSSLIEQTELIIFMIAACLYPEHFAMLASLFTMLLLTTAAGRIVLAWQVFGMSDETSEITADIIPPPEPKPEEELI